MLGGYAVAYNANTDYKALIDALKKQQAAAASASEKAALQSQIDAAEQSRLEKISSNLNAYGKYATDSELDSAAGILAQNQIGTGYETAKENLNKSYDNAKINASNDALSRGMARSSYVSDRLASLDKERANALSDIDAAKVKAIQSAKAQILNDYYNRQDKKLADEKKEFADNIMAYYNDYQAEINRVRDNGDTTDDWKIPYLQAARNEKIAAQEAAALKMAQQAAKSYGGYRRSGGSNSSGAKLTFSQLKSAVSDILNSGTEQDAYDFINNYGGQYADVLKTMYGLTNVGSSGNAGGGNYPQQLPDYNSNVIKDINTKLANGYTKDDILKAAASKFGVNSNTYRSYVEAFLRNR